MARIVHFSALLIIGAACFAAAVLAGIKGADARVAGADAPAAVCCIYMIF